MLSELSSEDELRAMISGINQTLIKKVEAIRDSHTLPVPYIASETDGNAPTNKNAPHQQPFYKTKKSRRPARVHIWKRSRNVQKAITAATRRQAHLKLEAVTAMTGRQTHHVIKIKHSPEDNNM